MATIIRGTTPTITYTFKTVDVFEISEAYLTIKQSGVLRIKKGLEDAEVTDGSISWTLAQEETLKCAGKVSVMCNWVTTGGIRGASKKTDVVMECNHIEGII